MTYHPFTVEGSNRKGGWLVTCEHATNLVPNSVAGGDLGVAPDDMARHIAYDVGAAGVTSALAELLDSPAILSNFSRLVIDANRGADDPTLLMKLYDGTIIPGNRHADHAELQRRMALCYLPYHDACAALAAVPDRAIVSIHSFTPQLRGRAPRPWHVGVLYAHDDRLAAPLLDVLQDQAGVCVGDNEPSHGHIGGDAMDRHALSHGRPHVLIELRNDLIADETGQRHWAERLAPLLETARMQANL